MTSLLYGLGMLLALKCMVAQTLVNFDQASKARIVWSEGLARFPRIARTQVRTPTLYFSADPGGLVIRGDRQCTVVVHPGRSLLLYVMWAKGQLGVFAGSMENGSYSPTLDHVDLTGDCVPLEATDDHRLPQGVQQILYIGVSGMPLGWIKFSGTCVPSIESYSMWDDGRMSVQDFRGFTHLSETTCGQ